MNSKYFLFAFGLLNFCLNFSSVAQANLDAPPVIREILNLRDRESIPESVWENYDSRTIGASIVRRIHLREEANRGLPYLAVPSNLFSETRLTLFFPAEKIPGIIAKGFLNQHQTQAPGGGLFKPPSRARLEDDLSRLNFEKTYSAATTNPRHAVRPKYAWLDYFGTVTTANGPPTRYGNVTAVLKDAVKHRTTWTYLDSLEGPFRAGIPLAQFKDQSTLYAGAIKDTAGSYLEAQIWGELDMRDVAYFLIEPESPQSVVDALRPAGLPIFEIHRIRVNNSVSFDKGKILFEGNEAQMAAYDSSLRALRPVSSAGWAEPTVSPNRDCLDIF